MRVCWTVQASTSDSSIEQIGSAIYADEKSREQALHSRDLGRLGSAEINAVNGRAADRNQPPESIHQGVEKANYL